MVDVADEKQKARLQNTGMLNAIAGVLLGSVFSYLVFVLDKRQPGFWFWLLVGGGVLLLVWSFVMSGRGIEQITKTHGYFNRQAWSVLLGFVLLAASLLFLGPQPVDKSAAQLAAIPQDVAKLEGRLAALEKALESERTRRDADVAAIANLRSEIAELQKRLPAKTTRKK